MEVKNNEFNGWYCAHCQCGVDPSEVTYHETHTVCGRYITDDEPPKLSDLEIVQKALSVENATLTINGSGNCFIDGEDEQIAQFSDFESLLTWAKQTIGE